MKYLKEKHGYTSLKFQYLQNQFPPLGGCKADEDGFTHMEEEKEGTEDSHEELECMRKQLSDLNSIQQQLLETKARRATEQRASKTAMLKLKHVEKVAYLAVTLKIIVIILQYC